MNKPLRALISVSDKTGIVEFASELAGAGVEIVSTGGTAKALKEAGIDVIGISDVTGFPEIMDGRVKTLHPNVHGGLLGRRGTDDAVMAEHGITGIDLLVVNLYPFEATVANPDCDYPTAIENIDIGGPAMIRAAAKNHAHVAVVVDPADYSVVLGELEGGISEATRRRLAKKAFGHTATYDGAIWRYLEGQVEDEATPVRLPVSLTLDSELRYGENPHQEAALYRLAGESTDGTVIGAEQLQGKELSFNNIADADAAYECVKTLEGNACVIVKHANPCGVGIGSNILEAYEKAYAADPVSAFGGIIAFNQPVDAETAKTIVDRQFLEVLIAPAIEPAAREVLAAKKNVRVLDAGSLANANAPGRQYHTVRGGILVQDRDTGLVLPEDMKIVTKRQPTPEEMANALLAWKVVKFVKSNAIVYCKDNATYGIGAGQMSRVVSAQIAGEKAKDAELDTQGASMASDAFFPFRDGVDMGVKWGITCIIQPGGSIRDEEVIAAADEQDIAMIFTGMRHFRH